MYAGLAMLAVAAATSSTVPMDGTRLSPGSTCYAIVANDKTVGSTWQSVHAGRQDGRATWDITVHQRFADGSFDMRDHFIVDQASMRPLIVESDQGKDRSAKGWHRVRLAYTDHGVSGTRETAAGTSPISATFDHPVWDGNLWGLAFAALPLKQGARFSLPTWQYDKGERTFTVTVVGRDVVHGESGDTDAWSVKVSYPGGHDVRYSIGVNPPAELGYAAGPFRQTLGGTCVGDEGP